MTGTELLHLSKSSGVMPVYNHPDLKVVMSVLEVCAEVGIKAFEFTNRGEKAPQVFRQAQQETASWEGFYLGVGTIFNREQAAYFVDEGAAFIVAPILDEPTASYCQSQNISWTPGCMTLTEIIRGKEWGASLIKIFPAHLLGPGFVKAVKGPCPELHLMPTGGVSQDQENLRSWFASGVHCVGLGSSVFRGDLSQPNNIKELKATLTEVVALTKEISV